MQLPSFSSFSFKNTAHKLTVGVIAVTLFLQICGPTLRSWLVFSPYRTLFHLEIWRPFTALLAASSPMELIFGSLIIYSIGGELEGWLGRQRFLTLILGIPLVSMFLTLLFTIVAPSHFLFATNGVTVIITTLWIMYGIRAHLTRQPLNFWGTPITGKTFALIGLGFVVLQVLFTPGSLTYTLPPVLPELFAAALVYLYMYSSRRGDPLGSIEMAFYNWKLRRMKAKRGLHVVESSEKKNNFTVH